MSMSVDRPRLVLHDDDAGCFGPLVELRPSFALRTGAMTTAERWAARFGAPCARRPAPALAALAAEEAPPRPLPDGGRFIVANGRLADPIEPEPGEALCGDGAILAANLDRAETERFLADGRWPDGLRRREIEARPLQAPWDILDGLGARIRADIEAWDAAADALGFARLPDPHPSRMGAHPILVHREAALAPQIALDASGGPIAIGRGAVVRPFATLVGPCSIGPGTIVGERALIKANTTCGPQCRLGGEIGGTTIAGFSNKSHDGHLGDSLVGEWVNLGAGTDNSNLLNTYGEVSVRLEPEGARRRTGRIFFGAVIGDHVKCAIGTRLMTGTVLGTGAMVATTAPPPTTVGAFAWLTDEGAHPYRLARFLDVLRAVLARRGREPGPAYLARIEALHAAAVRS